MLLSMQSALTNKTTFPSPWNQLVCIGNVKGYSEGSTCFNIDKLYNDNAAGL